MTYQEELFSTPTYLRMAMNETPDESLAQASQLVFCGCGTSYYLGAQLARLSIVQGRNAGAADAIELLDGSIPIDKAATYVFISRSGNSEETILAQKLVAENGADTFYLGCAPDSRLSHQCRGKRILPYGNEELILESYSFYVQLVGAMRCCGLKVEENTPDVVSEALELGRQYCSQWLPSHNLSRIITLGSPFYMPVLKEMMLKDGEITQIPAELWGILEFRHGPRSWCDENTLIHFISEEKTYCWDVHVAQELISYGCPVIWYGENAPEGCWHIHLNVPRYGAAEMLAYSAFHTSFAAELARTLNVHPEVLRHVVHNVGEL